MANAFAKNVLIGAGIAATISGLAFWGVYSREPRNDSPSRAPAEVRPAPVSPPAQRAPLKPYGGEIEIDVIANAQNDELSDGITLRFNRTTQLTFARYLPVFYDIPGIQLAPVALYPSVTPERSMSSVRTTFGRPESIDGKVLYILGTDPQTRKQVLLYKTPLNTGQKRADK